MRAAMRPSPRLDGARFRLRRWPSTALLQAHRYHLRLASFLSSRHVDLDELARLSNVGRPQCEEFLTTLLGDDLLDLKPIDVERRAPPSALPSVAPALADAPPRRLPPEPGLLRKIRLKLGMA